ncbi:hypothetical protein QPL79_03035 [Ignisphaera sp. 4213-co]|uniref:Small ribosomal subunit protein eS24 n=1 Tax=Ignisphaera cupida TaxID=3050454 RepID=A0ABD4Z5U5_9CREN|nr:hypothetical protein [Ignisphaera sp. 4213-co]MDK6028337.1 hypothetical protein [Ignisphaera sp. 4213-co]
MSSGIKLGYAGKTIKISDDLSVTVTREEENKLLSRIELEVYLDHVTRGTPSRKELQKILASIYGVAEDMIIVKKILSEYGRGSSKAHVHIYLDRNFIRLVEPKYILKRLGLES